MEEIYGAVRSFTELRRQAGQLATSDPDPVGWAGGFRRLLHIDEPAWLRRYQQVPRGTAEPAPPLSDAGARLLHMLYAQVQTRGALPAAAAAVAYLSAHPARRGGVGAAERGARGSLSAGDGVVPGR